jgi:hypothetical protein
VDSDEVEGWLYRWARKRDARVVCGKTADIVLMDVRGWMVGRNRCRCKSDADGRLLWIAADARGLCWGFKMPLWYASALSFPMSCFLVTLPENLVNLWLDLASDECAMQVASNPWPVPVALLTTVPAS